jgi:hypothetical protein
MVEPETAAAAKPVDITLPQSVFDAIVEIAKKNGPKMFPDATAKPVETGDKPGYKTTEFWLTLVVALAGIAMNLLPETSPASHYVGGVMTVLSAFGYTHARTTYKIAP